jgi:hypothetical protein
MSGLFLTRIITGFGGEAGDVKSWRADVLHNPFIGVRVSSVGADSGFIYT